MKTRRKKARPYSRMGKVLYSKEYQDWHRAAKAGHPHAALGEAHLRMCRERFGTGISPKYGLDERPRSPLAPRNRHPALSRRAEFINGPQPRI